MIQIQPREQFTEAVERLNREPQSIRRHEPHLYEVTNIRKGTQYHVRIKRRDGETFGSCTCPAGLRHKQAPLACKHLAAVIIYLRGIQAMRRRRALKFPLAMTLAWSLMLSGKSSLNVTV